MQNFNKRQATRDKKQETLSPAEGLISANELVIEALKNGVDFGRGNPILRLRYFVKLGIIPPPKRIVEHLTAAHKQPPKIVGYYTKETLDTLVKIHNLKEKGHKFGMIKKDLTTSKIDQNESQKPKSKTLQKSPTFKQNIQPKIKSPRFSIPRFNLFPNVGISEKDLEKKFRDHEQKLIRLLNPSSQNLSEFPQISGVKFAYLFKGLIIIVAATGLVSVTIISSKNYLSQILSNKEVSQKITTSNDLIGQVLAATSDTHRLYIDADTQVSGTTLFAENITAPNVLYGAVAGTGITVSTGQTPTIGLDTTGVVVSLNDLAGALTISGSGGTSISASGSTIKISSSSGVTSEADTLATVTGRGASTSTALTFTNGLTLGGNLSLSDTNSIFNLTNVGSLAFKDGTNTLLTLVDQGAYATLRLSDKGSTGDASTCTAGDIYFNGTDATVKACTATNTWEALDNAGAAWSGLTDPAANLSLSMSTYTTTFTSTATTQDIFTITASSLTSGSALVATGPTSTGVIDPFFKLSSDVGSGASVLNLNPDFSGSAVIGYGLYLAGTDSTSSANTDFGIYSSIVLSSNAAKTGYGIYSGISSTSTTADTLLAADFLTVHAGAISSGTKNVYGVRVQSLTDTPTDTGGTINTYGAHITATGAAGGTSRAYGIYATASAADTIFGINTTVTAASGTTAYALYADAGTGAGTEYAAVFQNGNVGIGTATPNQQLHLTKSSGDAAIQFETQGTSLNTGATSPSTAAVVSYGTENWTNPNNIKSDDNNYASITLAAGESTELSHYLKATNFGFSIPSGATIKGIQVIVTALESDVSGRYATESIRLVDSSGTISGNDNNSSSLLNALEIPYSHGSSSDLWGLTLTSSDINDSDFGVVFALRCTEIFGVGCADSGFSGYVEQITITVYYDNVSWTLGVDNSDSSKFKVSQSTALGTNDLVVFSNDTSADWTFGASGQLTLDASTTTNTTTTGVLDINATSTTDSHRAVDLNYTWGNATASTNGHGVFQTITRSQQSPASFNRLYGQYIDFDDTTNDPALDFGYVVDMDMTGTTDATRAGWGFYMDVNNADTADTLGNRITYGGQFLATGSTNGVSTAFGLRVDALGADTGYGLYAGAGTSTNNYGVYIVDQTGGTTDYGLYIAGADTYGLYSADTIAIDVGAVDGGQTGVCHTGTDIDSGTTSTVRSIGYCSLTANDYAETYATAQDVDYTDIVVAGTQMVQVTNIDGNGRVIPDSFHDEAELVKSSIPYDPMIIGIASDNHGDFSSIGKNGRIDSENHPLPIALSGRVPTKVSTENGPIKVGDYITSSSTAGVGMRATKAGRVIGMALGSFDCAQDSSEIIDHSLELDNSQNSTNSELPTQDSICQGQIVVFVNPTFYLGTNLASNGSLPSQFSTSEVENSYTSEVSLAGDQINADGTVNCQSSEASCDLDGQILTAAQIRMLVEDEVSKQLTIYNNQAFGSSDISTSDVENTSTSEVNDNEATSSSQLAHQTQQTLDELDSLLTTTHLSLDTLSVTGNTQLASTQVAGTFSQDGTLIIDYGKQINVLASTLYLQNDSLAGDESGILVDIGGGKLTIDNLGNLVIGGQLAADSLKTKEIIVYTDEGSAQTVGSASITSGSTQTTISTKALKPNAKVIITLTSPSQGKTIFVSQKNEFEGFTVSVENGSPSNPITFDWLIINTTESNNSI